MKSIKKEQKIGAVSTLLQRIQNLASPQEGYIRFYRGQDVSNHPNPSLFRNDGYIQNEHKMFYDVINQKPEEFANCKCTFDYLVKMQHYELPTRLLDITSNPLVALYFACNEERVGAEPTIFYIDVPAWLIKNYQSDSVTILSTLSKCNLYYKSELETQVEATSILVSFYISELTKIDSRILQNIEHFSYTNFILNIQNCIKDISSSIFSNLFVIHILKEQSEEQVIKNNIEEILNRLHLNEKRKIITSTEFSHEDIKNAVHFVLARVEDDRLLHEIHQDKPYFQDCMQYYTFQNIFCVQPKLDNTRIISQSGSFLLFPKQLAQSDWGEIQCNALQINPKKRKKILEDLALLNIKNDTMFSELDKVCGYIKLKHKK